MHAIYFSFLFANKENQAEQQQEEMTKMMMHCSYFSRYHCFWQNYKPYRRHFEVLLAELSLWFTRIWTEVVQVAAAFSV